MCCSDLYMSDEITLNFEMCLLTAADFLIYLMHGRCGIHYSHSYKAKQQQKKHAKSNQV